VSLPKTNDHSSKALGFWTLFQFGILTFVLISILAYPVDRTLLFLGDTLDRWLNLLVIAAWLYLLWAILSRLRNSIGIALFVLVILGSLSVRLLQFALVDFSGQGFADEFFVHIDVESLRIAWHEYDRLIRRAAILCALAAVCCAFWFVIANRIALRKPWSLPLFMKTLIASVCVVILISARSSMPEWQLWVAWSEWNAENFNHSHGQMTAESGLLFEDVREPALQRLSANISRWIDSGLLSIPPVANGAIQAELSGKHSNLLLLYVEALTTSIIEHEDYSNLMPGFSSLLDEHSFIDDFYASSQVTIEGIANTQCGLLFPFRGHGGFAGRTMLAEALPCLSDVLAAAGYQQSYVLGGGPMSFTGKGAFLAAHGFNDLRGWEYWRSRGFTRAPGHWGMGDIETLEQVRKLIVERREMDQPFNITALTVGSHIPGYSYPECNEYDANPERYLNALHCTDQVITKWIQSLQKEGLLDDTLLVVVGDHPVFSNPEMSRLFGSAIQDPRIPLIMIGDQIPDSQHQRGAGYDLAPTILDLLRIQHNAGFVMGRSLIRPHDRPDYFINRRFDIHEGKVVVPQDTDCDTDQSDEFSSIPIPLTGCDKNELMGTIRALTIAYSRQAAPLDCQHTAPLEVKVPTHDVGPASIVVNGRRWSSRFSWRGRIAHPNEKGLFVLAFSSTGQPQDRIFIPESVLQSDLEDDLVQDIEKSGFVLFVWRPSTSDAMDLSRVFLPLPSNQMGADIWAIDSTTDTVLRMGEQNQRAMELNLTSQECHRLFGSTGVD